MVDALGVRNATIEQSTNFVQRIGDIVELVAGFVSSYLKERNKHKTTIPQIITFGDTLVISWEMKSDLLPDYLPDVGIFLSYLIALGLDGNLAFRGAISVGDFIQHGATVLGPVVSDVAAWYDSAEMIGIIATPYCGQFLSDINETRNLTSMEFVKYNVPLKGDVSKNLWVVPWPKMLLEAQFFGAVKGKTPFQIYYKLIEQLSIPKGTENKYINTETFVRQIVRQKFEK